MEIGKTRSGTIIEFKPNQVIEEFSKEFESLSDGDKFDFFCMYQWPIVKIMPQKNYRPDDYEWWESRLNKVHELAGGE